MFAGRSVVSDLLFAPVDLGEVEVSCYDDICFLVLCTVLSEIHGELQETGDRHWRGGGVCSKKQSKWIYFV